MQEGETRVTGRNPTQSGSGRPSAKDKSYPVNIELRVEAVDVARGIVHMYEIIHLPRSVPSPERLTLLYPEWLPGYHGPQAPIELIAGLKVTSGGKTLSWQRDAVKVHDFEIQMPDGARSIEVTFQLLTPTNTEQGRVGITSRQFNLQWSSVLLYPKGYKFDEIGIRAQIALPEGWVSASALPPEECSKSAPAFAQVSLDVFVDSPLFAGRYYHRYRIAEGIALNVFGDEASQTEVGKGALGEIADMVAEADQLFGARSFDHYDFLISISDELGDLGVEHRRSAELVLPTDFFTSWEKTRDRNDVLAHEYVHAWNGKFRKGERACTHSFDEPIRNDLLWVYEGLTQYWGLVLATRGGLWHGQTFRDALALQAARCCNMKGRRWRPISDTTRDPIITERKSLPWESWQRNEDYYTDGQLLWLEVDVRLRQLSQGKRSLDDFARAFFGDCRGHFEVRPYGFEDVVTALNDLVPWDWKGFLENRLDRCQAEMPLDGITLAGYELVYRGSRSTYHRQTDGPSGLIDLTFSAGFSAEPEGKIKEVIWESPAFEAGLTVGTKILAVNDKPFSSEALCAAIGDTRKTPRVTLWVQKLKHCQEVRIAYDGGHRFPHLERRQEGSALLDQIIEPRR